MDSRPTYYLAGPMTGIPQFNFPLFDRVADALRESGYIIVSPAEMDDPETRKMALASPDGAPGSGSSSGETWGDFLARDVKLIADGVDGVFCLPGWQDSRGAVLETFCALLCGKPVYAVHIEHLPEEVVYERLDLGEVNFAHLGMLERQTEEVPSYGRATS